MHTSPNILCCGFFLKNAHNTVYIGKSCWQLGKKHVLKDECVYIFSHGFISTHSHKLHINVETETVKLKLKKMKKLKWINFSFES